jgi:hypothetical protein
MVGRTRSSRPATAKARWLTARPTDRREFRVIVREGTLEPLSKLVVVHVANEGGAWKVIGVDGPLP